MEATEFEIRSLGAFRKWLKEHGPEDGPWFGRVGLDHRSLVISHGTTFVYKRFGNERITLYPLHLPPDSPASAIGEWWRVTLAQVQSYLYYHPELNLYCIVRAGAWEALSDWCLNRPKSEWQPISRGDFRRAVGTAENAMLYEHQFTGIAVRHVRT